MSTIENYHAHIYFNPHQLSLAENLVEDIKTNFELEVGRIWNKPVGPHPIGSCQIKFSNQHMSTLIPFLMEHRGELDIFIHGNTDDDLIDHTQYIGWLGNSHKLNIEMFQK